VLALASIALLGLDWPGQGAARAAEFARTASATRRVELLHLLAPSPEPEARAALASALVDPEVIVREAARGLATRHPSDVLVPALLRVLEDPDADVRTEALDALAGARSPDARRAIERALSDRSPAVRAHAVIALSSAGADAVVALLDRVHDPEGDVRAAAAEALGRIGDPRATLALVGISQDPIPEVRLAATRALGALSGEVAVRALVSLVHDAMPDVRLAALRGLQQHPDPATVPTLAALARPERSASLAGRDDLARAAIAALGDIDTPEARRALLELALDARAARTRDAIAALGAHPERLRHDMGAILPRLHRDNVGALADLLGHVGGDDVATALLDLLGRADPSPSAANATAAMLRALGRSGSDLALRALLERLTSAPAPASRARAGGCARGAIEAALLDALALWADARQGLDPLALDPLAEALQRLDPSCRPQLAAMIRLLGRTGNRRAASALVAVLRHPDTTIRAAAAEALGHVASTDAMGPLVLALSDEDAAVRASAAGSLRALPSAALLPALSRRWREPSPVDRGALLLLIGHALGAEDLAPEARGAHLSLLVDAAARGPWRTRAAAVRALGAAVTHADPSALRALLRYATETRLAPVGIEALGNLPPDLVTPDVQAALAAQLDGAHGASVRAAAAWALRAAGADAVERLRGLVDLGASPVAHNALAALTRIHPNGDEATRSALRASIQGLVDLHPGPAMVANACAAITRFGGSCRGAVGNAPHPTGDAVTTDLRVLDPSREVHDRAVLVRLGDGVSVSVTPDFDGWIRVRDGAVGALEVLEADEGLQ